ncbi:hypothetical protein HMPREF3227_00005 [Corynebacterium sp. CMW7794]|nr:hypothetical protein HMPREF3227_00005 [Corynebacterium sp. CMW7794]
MDTVVTSIGILRRARVMMRRFVLILNLKRSPFYASCFAP